MNIVDAIIFVLLVFGALIGFKRGAIESGVRLVGTVLIFVLAFLFKNPLSVLMYQNLPFFKFGGILKGVSVVNILIYEAIAFIIVFVLLKIAFAIIIRLSRLVENLLKVTVVLILPSKIIGAVLGALEMYLVVFLVLFGFNQFNLFDNIAGKSKYGEVILTKTPILSDASEDVVKSIDEILTLKDKYKEEDKTNGEYNTEALDILLKYDIITKENAQKLIDKNKIEIVNNEDMLGDNND